MEGYGEQYAERWCVYVEAVVKVLHDGHARLAMHHSARPDLVHAGLTSTVVQEARTAIGDIIAALKARERDFPLTMRARRNGPVWDTLRGFFTTSCVAVRDVDVTLSLAIATLLDDDTTLPVSTPIFNSIHLSPEQRESLETAWVQLKVLTGDVVIQAVTRFAAGRHSTGASS
jgi:hypothetical protein